LPRIRGGKGGKGGKGTFAYPIRKRGGPLSRMSQLRTGKGREKQLLCMAVKGKKKICEKERSPSLSTNQ